MAPLGLSDGQFTALKFGVPVVAVLAFASAWSKKGDEDAKPGGAIPPTSLPTTDAIGVGQLAEFESGVTAALVQLSETVGYLASRPYGSTVPAGGGSSSPAPAPAADTYIASQSWEEPSPTVSQAIVEQFGDPCLPGWPCGLPGTVASPVVVDGQEIGVTFTDTSGVPTGQWQDTIYGNRYVPLTPGEREFELLKLIMSGGG